jgi:deoxyxylulose-5-phosphate synthase
MAGFGIQKIDAISTSIQIQFIPNPPIDPIEENVLAGGFGSAVLEQIGGAGFPVLRFGLPDAFVPHGDRRRLLEEVGLTARAIAAAARQPELTPAG